MAKELLYWICHVLGWGLYGALQIIANSFNRHYDAQQAFGVGLEVLFYILSTHVLRTIFIHFKWLNLALAKLMPRLLVITCVFGGINYLYLVGVQYTFDGGSSINWSFSTMFFNTLIYFLWTIFYLVIHYVEHNNNSVKAEVVAKEVELNNLKAQLNPHFIFNALNSIRALVDENPRKAKESITQLSHILRNSLGSDRRMLVAFSEELKTVMDYLALESMRYEERLVTKFDIDKNSRKFMLPPLMLQTLVENGIKHGISALKHGGEISITTKVQQHLKLEIRNSGQLQNRRSPFIGYGLENTKKRLSLIFGDEASFEIMNESKYNVLCSLTIPVAKERYLPNPIKL